MATYTVLGASGFVGSRIVKLLRAAGLHCYAPSRDEQDVFDADLGRVFFCIGLTADYVQRPLDTVEAHVSFLTKILRKAKFDRLIYLSSTRLYDGLPLERYSEAADLSLNPINPRHIYDLSKALGENLCMTAAGGRTSVARLSCVYDCDKDSPGFMSELLQRLAHSREFTIDSSSGLSRDYVSVDDVVVILKAILDGERAEIFNVASGENITNQEIVDTLNMLGCRVGISRYTETQKVGCCDIAKITSLGIRPVLLREYLKTYLRNVDGHAID